MSDAAETPTRRVLWAANVRTKSLKERIAAAEAGGFAHMSLFPIDCRRWADGGLPLEEQAAILRAAGVSVVAIDPYARWAPGWAVPEGMAPEDVAFVGFCEDEVLRMAEVLDAEAINCIEPFGADYDEAELTDALGAFVTRAAARGLRVRLEFMPMSAVRNLATALRIVEDVNDPALGLVFDTWHFFRGSPDLALLSRIDGARIAEVQLADGAAEPQGGGLQDDLLHHRRMPGDGVFDIAGAVAVLRAISGLRSAGPEVFSDDLDPLPAAEAGRSARASLDRCLS